MTEWKSRFNYTWDWVPRLVQIGVWDTITLQVSEEVNIHSMGCQASVEAASWTGSLRISAEISGEDGVLAQVSLFRGQQLIKQETVDLERFKHEGVFWQDLEVDLWYPNGHGPQALYQAKLKLIGKDGKIYDQKSQKIGFKLIAWKACPGAVPEADPWICQVNGESIFLQGFNWTPIRPNFADLQEEDYRIRINIYQEMGCNVLRVWGGAYLEKEIFYDLCDELGILVWQDFPLSSSGIDNWPPDDEVSIAKLSEIARSYIERRRHHVCLLMWCGGNELQGNLEGGKTGTGKPVDFSHPLIRRFADLVAEHDPGRRFVSTSSSGPRFSALTENFGKGLHWDVHGPWKANADLQEWSRYWQEVDALFHSEVGAPGASSAEIIRQYAGDLPVMPADESNPLWKRFSWWIEWEVFIQENEREPKSLGEYVAWSQARQAEALQIVASHLKERFPRVGGVIFWMGHDCFPCTSNTSVIDFLGCPKPAALGLEEVFWKK
jgi:beta-mannosidase